MDDYLKRLYEQLQWCSQDDFSINNFFLYREDITYNEKLMCHQISVEFLYRCLKCDLITFLNGSMIYPSEVNTFEDYAWFLTNLPIGIDEWQAKGTSLQEDVWTCEFLDGTDKLVKICEECMLEGYGEFSDSDPRWEIFVRKIEDVFSEQYLSWDFNNPLFPIVSSEYNKDSK